MKVLCFVGFLVCHILVKDYRNLNRNPKDHPANIPLNPP